jgi:ABC-type dipeptide/oligopeptide/nickel transport system permease component
MLCVVACVVHIRVGMPLSWHSFLRRASVCATVLALLASCLLSRPSFTYNINEMQRCLLFMKKVKFLKINYEHYSLKKG